MSPAAVRQLLAADADYTDALARARMRGARALAATIMGLDDDDLEALSVSYVHPMPLRGAANQELHRRARLTYGEVA